MMMTMRRRGEEEGEVEVEVEEEELTGKEVGNKQGENAYGRAGGRLRAPFPLVASRQTQSNKARTFWFSREEVSRQKLAEGSEEDAKENGT